MLDKDWCTCSMMSNGGDMSPRMWECEKHGITGMIGPMSIIKQAAPKLGIPLEEAKVQAFNELKRLQQESKDMDTIYFCEDHFCGDLEIYFSRLIKKKAPPKVVTVVTPSGHNWVYRLYKNLSNSLRGRKVKGI